MKIADSAEKNGGMCSVCGIRADRFHSLSNFCVQTNSFLLGDELAMMLTQSSRDVQEATVSVPGFEFIRLDSVSGDVSMRDGMVVIPRHGFAIQLYRKAA